MTQFQRVTIYADDDVTVLTDFSTDPAHPRPWLKPFEKMGEAAIDFVEGRTTIGQMSFKVIDKRTIANDQDSGALTAIIAANNGLLGNRVLCEQQRVGSTTYYKVFNGVITEHPLSDTLVTYNFSTRDNHERVRSSRLFTKLRGMTILPMGVESGYGLNPATGNYLIPPTAPLRGVFWRDPKKPTLAGRVKLNLTINQSMVRHEVYLMMQSKFGLPREIINELNGQSLGQFYPGVTIKWRPYPGGGAWTTWEGDTMPFVKDTEYSMRNVFPLDERIFQFVDRPGSDWGHGSTNWLVNFMKPAAGTLPTHQQQIEVIVLGNGEPSSDLPQYIDENFGDLLEKVTDGYYDKYPMGVTLNPGALDVMKSRTKRARTIITAPVEGDGAPKKWIESEIYKPNGYAPQLNDDGEVVPLKWELPDASVNLLEINDAIVRADAKWMLTDADAVNIIAFDTYSESLREARTGTELRFHRLQVHKQTDVEGNIESIAKLGLKEVTYKQTTVRSMSTLFADMFSDNALGARLRAERKAQVRDRFLKGAQRINAYCRRSAAGIQDAQEGAWCQVSISWLPEFGTGRRGTNRLMQIVKIREDSQAFRGFELLDAGPFAQPTAQPTLGVITVDADGYVTIPVTAVPVGGFARIDFALDAAQPATDSGLWQFGGRRDTVGNIVLGPFQSNTTIWYRARGEKEGTRRSAWTNAASIVVAYIIRAYDVRIEIDENGVPTMFFKTTNGTDAVRINYDVHPRNPDFLGALVPFIDVDDHTLGDVGVVLPVVVAFGEDIAVEVTAYRLGVAGLTSERAIEQSSFDSSGVPTLELQITGGDAHNTYVKPIAATPDGIGVTIYYAYGDDPFVLTVANGGTIAVPRSTNDSDSRHLRVKAVADNGLMDVKELTIDFDVIPEISITAEMVPIYDVGGVQIGWRIRGTSDEDTRGVSVAVAGGLAIQSATSSPGVFVGAVYWIDTRVTKTWWMDFLQTPGQTGTATITPREFYDSTQGLGGQPAVITLARAPITVHSIQRDNFTQYTVTLTATPATATIRHRINGGGWIEHVGTKVFQVFVETADQLIEYYSYLPGGSSEEIRRVNIDQDDQPEITSASLTESIPNNAHLEAGFDNDVVMWKFWSRRNLWPTTTPLDPAGEPLEWCLKYSGGVERTSLDFFAGGNGDGSSTWYGILRAYDKSGNFVQMNLSKLISGAPPVVGSLSNLLAQHATEVGLHYNDITWSHNQTVQDVNHTVTVRESDNGAGFAQLTIGRDARLEHDGGAVSALIGGFHVQKPWVAPGTPGAVFHQYNYQIDLRKSSDNSLIDTYTASMSAWEAGGGGGGGGGGDPPALPKPHTLNPYGEILQVRGTWVTPQALTQHIEWERNGVLQGIIALDVNIVTHTLTGLIAYDSMRFRVRYYNGYGNGTWSEWSAYTGVLPEGSAPTEQPDAGQTNYGGGVLSGSWSNTSSAYRIKVRFYRNSEQVGDEQDLDEGTNSASSIGGVASPGEGYFEVLYYNEVGAGPMATGSPVNF